MVSSEEWRFQKHVCIATLFALVTGYADVVSLVRYQAFASILTGNAIWLARVVVDPLSSKHTCWYYVAICSSFAFGSLIHRLCELKWPNEGGSTAARPLALLMLMGELAYVLTDCEVVFMESNCKEGYIHPYEKDLRWTVVLVAPLFGVIAAVCSTGRVGTHTTMVTGHILTLTGSMGNILMLRKLSPAERRKSLMSMMVITGTMAGACLGSWALLKAQVHHILLFPVPPLIYCLLWLHDHWPNKDP